MTVLKRSLGVCYYPEHWPEAKWAEDQRHFARQGDPDFQAFHHDLYRAVGRGRWWIMEQQPGR